MRLDLGAALRVLAKKHGVRVEEVKVAGVSDMLEALKTMPPATERTCVEASLSTVESGLPRLVERAQAWTSGNVERIENMPELKEVDACRNALDAGKGASMSSAAFARPGLKTSKNICAPRARRSPWSTWTCMLERGGLLEQLRAKGYEIDAP